MFNFLKNKKRTEQNRQRLIGRDDFLAALGRSGLVGNIGCSPYNRESNIFTAIEDATHFAFYEMNDLDEIISHTIVDASLDAFIPSSDLDYAKNVWDLIVKQFPKRGLLTTKVNDISQVDIKDENEFIHMAIAPEFEEFQRKSKELDAILPSSFYVLDLGPSAHRYRLTITTLRFECEELLDLLREFHPNETVGVICSSYVKQLEDRKTQIEKLIAYLDELDSA